jgi:hypothetical protein
VPKKIIVVLIATLAVGLIPAGSAGSGSTVASAAADPADARQPRVENPSPPRSGSPRARAAQSPGITADPDATHLAAAMSSQAGLVKGAAWLAGPSSPAAVGTAGPRGRFFPTDGTESALLTTGHVANAEPPNDSSNTGTNNGTVERDVNDVSILNVLVDVPSGHDCLAIDAAFYSEEFPEFIGSQFNDFFLAQIDNSQWAYDPGTNTVNAPGNFGFDTTGRQLTVNTVLVDPRETFLEFDGSTVLLRMRTPVTAGEHSLFFTIADAGDHIYDSAAFLDALRTFDAPPGGCPSGTTPADADGDGIPNDREISGFDADNNGTIDLDLREMGADPDHKDLFVELDAQPGMRLDQAAIDRVVQAFADAPVANPDGTSGINLHVDNGPNSVMDPETGDRWGALSEAGDNIGGGAVLGAFEANGIDYNWGEFDQVRDIAVARRPVFRYALSIRRFGNATDTHSGVARGIPNSDFIVALGQSGAPAGNVSTNEQAGTFMHELGHTLGLRHGGDQDINYKPNYLSVMNYAFQFNGLQRTSGGSLIDFSRFGPRSDTSSGRGSMSGLQERSLVEAAGLGATAGAIGFRSLRMCHLRANPNQPPRFVERLIRGMNRPVDWNCNRQVDTAPVAASATDDDFLDDLTPFDDWSAIAYTGGAVGGPGRAPTLPATSPNTEDATIAELRESARVLAGDRRKPTIRFRVKGLRAPRCAPGRPPCAVTGIRRRSRVKVTAGDRKALDRLVVRIDGRRPRVLLVKRGNRKLITHTFRLRRGRHTITANAIDRVGNRSTRRLGVR